MGRLGVDYGVILCYECGHELREHQPRGNVRLRSGELPLQICSACDCTITTYRKVRAWGGR